MKDCSRFTARGARLWLRAALRDARDLLLIALDTPVLAILRLRVRRSSRARERVAIFSLHGAGDLVLSLPCLHQLRLTFPAERYELTLFCSPLGAELASLYAPVDHLSTIDRHSFQRSPGYRIAVLRTIVDAEFSVAIQPTFNRMLAVEDSLVRATGAQETCGSAGSPMFVGRGSRWFGDRWYNQLVQPSPEPMHELARYAEFLAVMGWRSLQAALPALAAPPGPPVGEHADFILVIPDSSSPLKSWRMENFEELSHLLAGKTASAIAFAGAPDALRPKDRFRRWQEGRFDDFTGRTTMPEFLRLIAGARLVVTNDSGGMHLALALGRPVVAVAGGGLPHRYHPYPPASGAPALRVVENSLPCYGCNWRCIYPVAPGAPAFCVDSVTVSQVLDAVMALAGNPPPPMPEMASEVGRA
jgi:ADP-heptose:LPS heptosyltransferase